MEGIPGTPEKEGLCDGPERGVQHEEIQLLLKSVNFYPPAQFMKGIEQNEEAIARFLKMGNYPNLLEVGEGRG